MYLPCRALFDRLLEIAREGQSEAAAKVLDVLVSCNARNDCPQRAACKVDIDNACKSLGLDGPPCGEKK